MYVEYKNCTDCIKFGIEKLPIKAIMEILKYSSMEMVISLKLFKCGIGIVRK